MKILLASISLEFPLANYCLAAQILASPSLKGCQVELLDLDWKRISSYERKNAEIWRYLAKLDGEKPDVIGFSVYLWNHLAIRELVTITHLLFPSIRIVIGGPEVATTEAAEEWLQTCAVSVVVRGEGEHTFEEVLRRFAQGDDTSGVLGTSGYRSGRFVHEERPPPVKDLGELASPFLSGLVRPDLFDRETTTPQFAPYARVLMETYRGCYMQCSYCQWGNGSSARFEFPEDRLKQEISWLLSHNVCAIFFVDAMFGFKKRRAIALLEYIIQEKRNLGARTRFSLYHNQDFFDPHLFDLYREADAAIEVDLQSTNRDVLNRLGRGRWHTDTFDRHLTAVREQRVPTTGAADLIIGIPGDDLESFQESIDFLLRRQMRVNLYQASILPDTGWSRSVKQDGTVFSPLPPRAILKNSTFPLRDMITARLIGHGTDLFNSFPRTAEVLWRRWFKRPVDLCRAVGETIFCNHGLMYGESHQYDWVMGSYLKSLAGLIRTLCPEPDKADVVVELLKFEGALAAVTWASGKDRLCASKNWEVADTEWMTERPEFRRESVHRVKFRYRIHEFVLAWDNNPDPGLLESVTEHPNAVLFFNDGRPQYFAIDLAITDRLLQRFNGYFSVKEVLDNLALHLPSLSPVWEMLSLLAASGLISPGPPENSAFPTRYEAVPVCAEAV
jgi:radical SAM superfamily enzyme YgiQ (UPF0313 family)